MGQGFHVLYLSFPFLPRLACEVLAANWWLPLRESDTTQHIGARFRPGCEISWRCIMPGACVVYHLGSARLAQSVERQSVASLAPCLPSFSIMCKYSFSYFEGSKLSFPLLIRINIHAGSHPTQVTFPNPCTTCVQGFNNIRICFDMPLNIPSKNAGLKSLSPAGLHDSTRNMLRYKKWL